MRAIFAALRRRHVFRWAGGATLASAGLSSAVAQYGGLYGLPEDFQRIAIPALFALVPLAALVAWFINADAEDPTPVSHDRVRPFDLVLLVLVLGALVLFGYVVWRDERPVERPPPIIDRATFDAPTPSIAVLPFVVEAEALNPAYGRGVAEEIYHLLAGAEDLRAPAPSSAFQFAPGGQALIEVGAALRVRHVLEGSLATGAEPGQVRIRARLVNVVSDEAAWSDVRDVALSDIRRAERDIAVAALTALGVAPSIALAPQNEVDPEVYERFLEARARLAERTRESVAEARRLFAALVEDTPDDPGVLVGAAQAILLSVEGEYGDTPVALAVAQARPLIDRARGLAPALASVHATEGLLRLVAGQPGQAERALERALTLAPTDAQALTWLAHARSRQGQDWAARAALAQAVDLDPFSLALYPAFATEFAGARPDDVAALSDRFTIRYPDHPFLALAEAARREVEGALDEAHAILLPLAEGDTAARPLARQRLGWIYWRLGLVEEMRAMLAGAYDPSYIDAMIAQREGRCEDAAAIGRAALERFPDDLSWRADTAIWTACAGAWNEARALLEPLDDRSDDFGGELFAAAPETPGLLAALLSIARRREGAEAAADELAEQFAQYADALREFSSERLISDQELHLTHAYAAAARGDAAAVITAFSDAFDAGLREPLDGDPVFRAFAQAEGAETLSDAADEVFRSQTATVRTRLARER